MNATDQHGGLEPIVETFQSVDPELRAEVLLDYARRLPELPSELAAERDAGTHRVHECMTPVHLWVVPEEGGGGQAGDPVVRVHADVAEEAPTVQGLLSIIVHACSGRRASEAANLPLDLVNRLGLSSLVRMNRVVGLNAVISRVRREAAAAQNGGG